MSMGSNTDRSAQTLWMQTPTQMQTPLDADPPACRTSACRAASLPKIHEILQDRVNKRVVCILLECFLVLYRITCKLSA